MKLKSIWLGIALCFMVASAVVAGPESEADHRDAWCAEHNGRAEVVLPDRTRVDCLTDDYAVEVEFARKWAESIGQALHYAAMTGKEPAIVLIITGEGDIRLLERLETALAQGGLSIKIFVRSGD